MKNILITGGLGHLGSYLLHTQDELLKYNNITLVDNLHTQRYCSLMNLPYKIDFVQKDFNALSMEELDGFDVLIHLAAIVDAAKSFQAKQLIEEVNIKNTISLFEKFWLINPHATIVFPSSTSVYGSGEGIMVEDDDSLVNSQSPYASSKYEVEKWLATQKNKHYTMRLGTISGYSPGMRFHTAINLFCYQASFGQPLTVWQQNKNHVRPYLSLYDFGQVVQFLIEDDVKSGTYNVVSENLSLQTIIDYIKSFISPVKIEYVDTPLLNQYSYEVLVDKIKEAGFDEFYGSVELDIRKTIEKLGRGKHRATK